MNKTKRAGGPERPAGEERNPETQESVRQREMVRAAANALEKLRKIDGDLAARLQDNPVPPKRRTRNRGR